MSCDTTQSLMPAPLIYEAEYDYWPWGRLLDKLLDWLIKEAPREGIVFDYMCGTGRLLHLLSHERPDLILAGCDISKTFISYGKEKYPDIQLEVMDALQKNLSPKPDIILCLAGIHHLQPATRLPFLDKVASELNPDGFLIIGEECIRSWGNEIERKSAVMELSIALLRELVTSGAPDEQLEAAIHVFQNDLFLRGEFKCDIDEFVTMLSGKFIVKDVVQVWPTGGGPFGDYLIFSKLQ